MNTTTNTGGRERSLQEQRARAAFWFLAPMLIMLFCVAAWPLFRSIYFSFTNTTLSSLYTGEWIGFDNYLSRRELSSGRVLWRGTHPIFDQFSRHPSRHDRACLKEIRDA